MENEQNYQHRGEKRSETSKIIRIAIKKSDQDLATKQRKWGRVGRWVGAPVRNTKHTKTKNRGRERGREGDTKVIAPSQSIKYSI